MKTPKFSRNAKLRLWAQLGFGLLLLFLLLRGLDAAEVGRLLARADWGWLGWAVVALTLQTFASALRWWMTARALGQHFSLIRATSEYYLAQFFNQTLPGGMLGDAGRALRARHHAGIVRASQAVAFERLSGQFALFTILAVAVILAAIVPFGASWPLWLTAAGLAPALVLATLTALVFLGAQLPGALGRGLGDVRAAFRNSMLGRYLPFQIALSFATAGLNVAAFAFAARATGTELTLAETLALGPAILAFMLIPLTVSGWGLREGAAAALFPLAGASAEAGLAASVAFGLSFLVTCLPGAIPFARMKSLKIHWVDALKDDEIDAIPLDMLVSAEAREEAAREAQADGPAIWRALANRSAHARAAAADPAVPRRAAARLRNANTRRPAG